MKRSTVQTWYLIHKWTSLVCTLFMLLLCVTGLPLIFGEEIAHLTGAEPEVAAAARDARPVNLDTLIAKAVATYPGDVPLFLGWDAEAPIVYVNTGARPDTPPAEMRTALFHATTGAPIAAPQFNDGPMYVLFRLHTDLYTGLPGTLFLGGMGVLLVAAIVSGVVLYRPFMRKLDFGTVRRQRSRRLKWLDLHNLLGITTALWLVVVALTGVLNSLEKPLYQSWQDGQIAEMTAAWRGKPIPERLGSIEQAVREARTAVPNMRPGFVSFPGTGYSGSHHYGVFMVGNTPLTSRTYQPVLIDAETARFTATARWPASMQALYLTQPLHFGDYAGLPLKLLWAALDVVAIILLASGVYLWFGRRSSPLSQRVEEVRRGGLEKIA